MVKKNMIRLGMLTCAASLLIQLPFLLCFLGRKMHPGILVHGCHQLGVEISKASRTLGPTITLLLLL